MKKSHDIALEIAFISWLYLLLIGLKAARKCDKNATNSEKTCFVRLCAPLFWMPSSISYGYIMGCYMPSAMGWVRYSAPTLTPSICWTVYHGFPQKCGKWYALKWGRPPTQKSVSIAACVDGVNLTDCHRPAQNCAGAGCVQIWTGSRCPQN